MSTLAITGGTGFVGSTLIRLAVERGHQVRALARTPQPEQDSVVWIAGSLDNAARLATLVDGAEAVIHVAGVVNTPTREGFIAGNITGTEAVLAAAQAAHVRRFIHVSSLAARAPALSVYGWSKAEAEARVAASALDWTMVRPPAIYGPGDRDQLDLFKAARYGFMPLPPEGRLSLLEVRDLARLLLAVIPARDAMHRIYEADDGVPGGWSHVDYARAIGDAMQRRVLALSMPAALVRLGARVDRVLRGDKAKLTADRASYMCHPDWVISAAARPPAPLWTPQIESRAGLRATADWYRQAGWL